MIYQTNLEAFKDEELSYLLTSLEQCFGNVSETLTKQNFGVSFWKSFILIEQRFRKLERSNPIWSIWIWLFGLVKCVKQK